MEMLTIPLQAELLIANHVLGVTLGVFRQIVLYHPPISIMPVHHLNLLSVTLTLAQDHNKSGNQNVYGLISSNYFNWLL